jgi:hypothetical protein
MKIVWSRRAIGHLVHIREYIAKNSEQNAGLVAGRILEAVDLLHGDRSAWQDSWNTRVGHTQCALHHPVPDPA